MSEVDFRGYDLLRNEIIRYAIKDYRRLKMRNDPTDQRELQALRRFFLSDCGILLIDKKITGIEILAMLDEECDNMSQSD